MRNTKSWITFALAICIACLSGCAGSSHRSLNKPGEPVAIREHLVAGKTNIVYFYADW
ncbi:MAG: hypothetical protein AB7U82_07280 [Blastocatellales bacterium]